ncbi:MAG: anhydro-N-acetylmuramic acid kinase, partial [Gammaproteobacteria bacterium]
MPDAELYIGLMSGTSADSIDAALVDFSHGQCQLLGTHSSDIS